MSGTIALEQGLVTIELSHLPTMPSLACDLFVCCSDDTPAIVYRRRGYPFGPKERECLLAAGIHEVLVREEEHSLLCDRSQHSPAGETCPTAEEGWRQVRAKARGRFMSALFGRRFNELVDLAAAIGEEVVRVAPGVNRGANSLACLVQRHDDLFARACNVALYCVVLARLAGIERQADLQAIAVGGLLHDIGKRAVPPGVLRKKARLTDEEMLLVREHPSIGFRDLCRCPGLIWPQLMMVYQHHERLDGRGYPVGIGEDEIHHWARICAIADVFDALTSRGLSRRQVGEVEANRLLRAGAGRKFDRQLVECWLSYSTVD